MQNASAILSTFIKLLFVIKIVVLSIFEWPFHTGFIVLLCVIITCLPFFSFIAHDMVLLARNPDFVCMQTTKDADQTAHLHSLISTFFICYLESIVVKLNTSRFLYFLTSHCS